MGGDESARKWGGATRPKPGEGGNMGVRFSWNKSPKRNLKNGEPGGQKPGGEIME